jgi:hypothetical protein
MTGDLAGQVRAICLALPEVTERLSHGAPTWFVRDKKAFVTMWAHGHHANDFPHLWCAGPPGGWREFRRQLEYKCERYGRQLLVTGPWCPSSKTCSACGHLLAQLSLSTRHWACPSCGTRHDRDINAAKNILAAGLAVARGSPGDACGAGVRHSGTSRMQPAVKQEPQPVTAGIPAHQGGE